MEITGRPYTAQWQYGGEFQGWNNFSNEGTYEGTKAGTKAISPDWRCGNPTFFIRVKLSNGVTSAPTPAL